MIFPEPGQHIKCLLTNGVLLEGTVIEWGDKQAVLKSLDGQNLMIVHRPATDIIMTKIMLGDKPKEISVPPTTSNREEHREDYIKKKLEEIQSTIDTDLQKKSVEELRQMVLEEERQILANKKKQHFGTAGSAKLTRYSSPYMPGTLPNWVYGQPLKRK
jgi:hypothetical protein